MHGLEGWRGETLEAVEELLGELGVERREVDLDMLDSEVDMLLRERGWSPRRTIDLMHVLAAKPSDATG